MHRTTLENLPEGVLARVGDFLPDDAELLEFAQLSRRKDVLRARFLRNPLRMLRLAMNMADVGDFVLFADIGQDTGLGIKFPLSEDERSILREMLRTEDAQWVKDDRVWDITYRVGTPLLVMVDEHIVPNPADHPEGGMQMSSLDIHDPVLVYTTLASAIQGVRSACERFCVQDGHTVLAHALRIMDRRLWYLLRMLSVMPHPVRTGPAVGGDVDA